MHEFYYDYMKPKYGKNLRLCYMDTDSLVYNTETDNFYKDIAGDVETIFDTNGYSQNCPLPIRVKKEGHWDDKGRTGRKMHD